MNLRLLAVLALPALSPPASAQTSPVEEVRRPAAVSTMDETELAEFSAQPPKIQALIRSALALTRLNLTYLFGSNDPERGGMDCSGTMHHLLSKAGIKNAPRQSDEMCDWVAAKGRLHRITLAASPDHPEFAALRPGDLIFWSGTYEPTLRRTPVTHVMLYLGTNQKSGKPVIFGASDGRRHEGQRHTGVSVFDFVLPRPDSKAAVHGYGSVPGLITVSAASPIEPRPQSPPPARKDL
jgi:cell wall-associated NlpC family hydrolase